MKCLYHIIIAAIMQVEGLSAAHLANGPVCWERQGGFWGRDSRLVLTPRLPAPHHTTLRHSM